jgi:hypothetical protein
MSPLPTRARIGQATFTIVLAAVCTTTAPVAAQPAPPRPPGARPALVVGADGRAGQPVTPLPAPDAPTPGGRALTVRGVGHDYALINTAAELSPDGTLLAFLRADRPFVRHLPSGVETSLFSGRMRDVDVRFVGFAPDSRRLAYTVNARQTMEGPPSIFPIPAGAWVATVSLQGPPEGVRSPVPVLRVASNTRLERAGADDTLSFWSADGTALLGRAHEAQYVETLRRTPVDGGAPTALHSVRAYLGMIQLHTRGDRAVFQYTPLDVRNRPGQTALATLPLSPAASPVAPRVIVPVRSGNAGPELSPDASQVAYTDLDAGGAAQLFVVPVEGGAAPRALHPCRTRCDFRWESDATLLLVHGEALVRVSTTGAAPQTVVPRGVRTVLVGGGS